MNGNKLMVDTNVLLYLMQGDSTLVSILEGKNIYVSFVTELELYSFRPLSQEEKSKINILLSQCTIIDITAGIKQFTIDLRQNYPIKLPDSIIAGTSLYLDIPLFSADKGFKNIEPLDFIFYEK
ncbi:MULTISPECIES: type II toxin-antitoxin system VapC family toxin [Cognataquiflexum]|jgi:predicted nucleic acid-binding protein|uniref:type II toxin-antitoxin system VapC family toxin n=1 Tax=Cognataquiflexum TaxID=3020066 RepID=UPI000DE9F17F|nr:MULTISPECIES: type II toxin-antitoxin system VapC family toxin [Cognataquiflexum]MCH6232658.1 type II toxin-antitoxin system VapC family toxin [Cognataquiflexum rubidum]